MKKDFAIHNLEVYFWMGYNMDMIRRQRILNYYKLTKN